MSAASDASRWLTAREISELWAGSWPTVSAVRRWARSSGWARCVDSNGDLLSRTRRVRGLPWEYHFSVLPCTVWAKIVMRPYAQEAQQNVFECARADHLIYWAWFNLQPQNIKDEAKRRALILSAVEELLEVGLTLRLAIVVLASPNGTSATTIKRWRRAVCGIRGVDRLPYLAPGCPVSMEHVTSILNGARSA